MTYIFTKITHNPYMFFNTLYGFKTQHIKKVLL